MYGVKRLDYDIVGANLLDVAANDRRAQALVRLKAANPGLINSYTLPTTTTGLSWIGLIIAQSNNNGFSRMNLNLFLFLMLMAFLNLIHHFQEKE